MNKVNQLTREEMRNVVGGTAGTCCAHLNDWSDAVCGVSRSDAQDIISYFPSGSAKWCCASCESSFEASQVQYYYA